jgi:hypothetical protein
MKGASMTRMTDSREAWKIVRRLARFIKRDVRIQKPDGEWANDQFFCKLCGCSWIPKCDETEIHMIGCEVHMARRLLARRKGKAK